MTVCWRKCDDLIWEAEESLLENPVGMKQLGGTIEIQSCFPSKPGLSISPLGFPRAGGDRLRGRVVVTRSPSSEAVGGSNVDEIENGIMGIHNARDTSTNQAQRFFIVARLPCPAMASWIWISTSCPKTETGGQVRAGDDLPFFGVTFPRFRLVSKSINLWAKAA